jgi:hypothetical protein
MTIAMTLAVKAKADAYIRAMIAHDDASAVLATHYAARSCDRAARATFDATFAAFDAACEDLVKVADAYIAARRASDDRAHAAVRAAIAARVQA